MGPNQEKKKGVISDFFKNKQKQLENWVPLRKLARCWVSTTFKALLKTYLFGNFFFFTDKKRQKKVEKKKNSLKMYFNQLSVACSIQNLVEIPTSDPKSEQFKWLNNQLLFFWEWIANILINKMWYKKWGEVRQGAEGD